MGRLPIELKPAGGKTFADLTAAVSDQLCGRYMVPEEVTHGILVVFRNRAQQWRVGEKLVGFDELVFALREYARDFGGGRNKMITVTAIDLVGPSSGR